jgi:hypothetical protein
VNVHLNRLNYVLDYADSIDWQEGAIAYIRYRETMLRFAEHYSFSLEQVVSVFAALSPNSDYKGNLKSMATVLHGIREGWSSDDFTVTTYRACFNRAYLYATGACAFLDHCKGPKTRSFYQNIVDPYDPLPVTVDGHMLGIWHGQRMTMVEAVRLRYRYSDVADGIRTVALSRSLRGNQAQAILWFSWKRMNNSVYSPQLSLFQKDDQWGSDIHPSQVKPFSRRVKR